MARHKYHKGKFKPSNPQKYRGDNKKIVYRSSWELKYMMYLDRDSNILRWASEPFPIQYYAEHDRRWHDYWPDFWMHTTDGTFLVEVKPLKETKPPRKSKRKGDYLTEMKRKYRERERWRKWAINQAKWEAAREFCKQNNLEFVIVTEKELGLKNKKRP